MSKAGERATYNWENKKRQIQDKRYKSQREALLSEEGGRPRRLSSSVFEVFGESNYRDCCSRNLDSHIPYCCWWANTWSGSNSTAPVEKLLCDSQGCLTARRPVVLDQAVNSCSRPQPWSSTFACPWINACSFTSVSGTSSMWTQDFRHILFCSYLTSHAVNFY